MQYFKITFPDTTQDTKDILIATLAEIGFEGFEETETSLLAFIPAPDLNKELLAEIAGDHQITFQIETIPAQNWNALWESNFQPVIVDDFCTIKAHFHDITVTTPYDIVVTPKMSFGTGHHATTQLMILMMKDIYFKGRSVLDFGTGTGVLAILAEMLGASEITAIDNDEWSVENAKENVARNNCSSIAVSQGSIEDLGGKPVDVILANINRHILLRYMADLYKMLHTSGFVLMSGLLTDDEHIIKTAAAEAGLKFLKMQERNNWIALLFEKGNRS